MRALFILIAAFSVAPAMAQDAPYAATPKARAAMRDFAQCVVRNSPAKAHSALTRDFRAPAYRTELRLLADMNRGCFERGRGRMRAGGLPFAAAMAEALLKADATPLNVRLLRAAGTEARTFAPSDKVAMCVARSDPDHVSALLAAEIATAAERKAAADLGPAVSRCTPSGIAVDLTPYGLRAILATASYRLLATAGGLN